VERDLTADAISFSVHEVLEEYTGQQIQQIDGIDDAFLFSIISGGPVTFVGLGSVLPVEASTRSARSSPPKMIDSVRPAPIAVVTAVSGGTAATSEHDSTGGLYSTRRDRPVPQLSPRSEKLLADEVEKMAKTEHVVAMHQLAKLPAVAARRRPKQRGPMNVQNKKKVSSARAARRALLEAGKQSLFGARHKIDPFAIISAARVGDVKLGLKLLKMGKHDVNTRDGSGATALIHSVWYVIVWSLLHYTTSKV